MKQSKLLKKSLAALLAILMVAAMIPMSAFADEAPAEKQKPAFIESITLGADSEAAQWDPALGEDGGFKVALSGVRVGDKNDAGNIKIAWLRAAGQTGSLKISGGATMPAETVGTNPLDLAKAASGTATSPETGEYTFNLTDGTATWPLVIDWTRREASTDATIRRVNYRAIQNVLGAEVGADTITLTMGFGQTAQVVDLNGDAFTTGTAGNIKTAFIPNNSGASVVYDGSSSPKTLTVTAESGLTKTYTVAFTNEPAITKFELPGQVGETKIDNAAKTISLNMPFGTENGDKFTATMDWGENVETVGGKKVKEQEITLGTGSAPYAGKLTATIAVKTIKGVSSTTNEYTIVVTVPSENTEAKINSIRLVKGGVSATDLGQTINIVDNGQDVQNVTITLPNATVMDAGNNGASTPVDYLWSAVVDASEGAKAKTDRNADSYTSIPLGGSINLTRVLGKTFTIDVESQDGKAHKFYNFTVATASATDENLESVSITSPDGKTTYTGVKDPSGTKSFDITVPFANGKGAWTLDTTLKIAEDTFPLEGWTVNAKASAGATVTYTGYDNTTVATYLASDRSGDGITDGAGSSQTFVDGATLVASMTVKNGGFKGDPAKNTLAVGVKNTTGAGAATPWNINIIQGKPNETGVIESVKVTGGEDESAVEDDPSLDYETTFDKTAKTIKVTLPYAHKDTDELYFSELKMSDGAVAIVKPSQVANAAGAASLSGVVAWNEDGNDADDIYAANCIKQAGLTATPVEIWVFSENAWKDIDGKPFCEDAATGSQDAAPSHVTYATVASKVSSIYKLSGEYPAAATGAQLLSIESTVDKNVTASYANNEVTLTVPATYIPSAVPSTSANTAPTDGKVFTLNWKVSDKATVAAKDTASQNTQTTWTSDEGKDTTAGATKFVAHSTGLFYSVYNGATWSNWANLYSQVNNPGQAMLIVAEDGKTTNPVSINVKITPVETGAELTSLLVGETAAEADPENDTTAVKAWKVTLPYGTSLNQPLNITASKMAAISVDGVSYDASANDIFDLSDGVTIKVTSEDKKTTNTYKLTVAFGEPSTEADITAAKVGEVEATIAGETITAVVAEDFDFTQAVAVSFEVSEGAKVTKLGEAAPTETYTFTDGEAVAVEVTAQDGKTTKTYQLVVTTKKPSSENTITELTVDGVAATIAEEAITAEAENPASVTLGIKVSEGATVTVNGKEYTAGDSIDATEPVTIVVTAEDGTEKTYTLTVTKKAEQPKPGLDDVNDVEEGKYFSEAVANMLAKGIMSTNGDKNFRPDGNVPRRDFAIMICKLYGIDTAEYADYENPFVDVKKGDYFYNAVMAAVANDLMVGSGSQFNPGENVSRQQAAVVLAAAQKLEEPTEYKAFNDDAQIASWAKKQVYACRVAGIIAGRSGNVFDPLSPIARKDMAVILNGIEPVEQEPGEPENPDEGNNPENPDEGNNPENPDEGNNPENPDEGNTPENPDGGNNPENPDEGNTPENPDEGNNPENPDEGNNPENPDEGNNPENPDEGNTPETPDEGETPAE